jgi:hypothetical protein
VAITDFFTLGTRFFVLFLIGGGGGGGGGGDEGTDELIGII